LKSILNKLGPGILYAGAAIGVSHLIQSTRAGAVFGFYLIGVVIITNIIKYPFFEISPIYTSKKKKNLLEGYRDLHPIILVIFLLIMLSTFLIIVSAITLVTAGLAALLIPLDVSLNFWIAVMAIFAVTIIYFGHYKYLKVFTRYVVLLLAFFSIVAVIIAFSEAREFSFYLGNPLELNDALDLAFLLALIGWMPAPMELSAWHSSWTMAEDKLPEYKDAMFDFKAGYWGTMVLAIVFLTLGAIVMFGSGTSFSNSPVNFAGQLVNLFTAQFGNWSYFIIAFAAFATMVSTLLTSFDAHPRVLSEGYRFLIGKPRNRSIKKLDNALLFISGIGVIIILYFFSGNIKAMVDFATIVSFLAAAMLSVINFLVAYRLYKEGLYPKGWIRWFLMAIGMVALISLSIIYLYLKFKG
jgi:Mn2+/Fe2+ NRAMP family transporter